MVSSALRWIALLPASVIAYIATDTAFFYLANWNLRLLNHIPTLIPSDAITAVQLLFPPAASSFAGGVALIVSGAAVAPKFRTATALVLLIANVVFLTGAIVLHLVGVPTDRPLAVVVVGFLGGLSGAGVAYAVVAKKLGWQPTAPISNVWQSGAT